jgi:Tol biopolymer transport system component
MASAILCLFSVLLSRSMVCADQLQMSDAEQISKNSSGEPPSSPTGLLPGSEDPEFSPDGDVLVFSSGATDLDPHLRHETDTSLSPNVYMKRSSSIELVSRNIAGRLPKKNTAGSRDLVFGAISPAVSRVVAGKFAVAFTSDAHDLVPNYVQPSPVDGIVPRQVYLRLPFRDESILVSGRHDLRSTHGGNGASDQPTVAFRGFSEKGMVYRVAFRSLAADLQSMSLSNPKPIVYWRDIIVPDDREESVTVGDVTRILTASAGCTMEAPALSADGGSLAFSSDGEVLTGITSIQPQMYVYDFDGNIAPRLSLISRAGVSASAPANSKSTYPSLSHSGDKIVFVHYPVGGATNLTGIAEGRMKPLLVLCNVPTDATVAVVCQQVNSDAKGIPSNGSVISGRIDASGRYVAFSDTGSNIYQEGRTGEITPQVYLKDIAATDGEIVQPVYLASKKTSEQQVSPGNQPSGQMSLNSKLLSRPPVSAAVNEEGKVLVAFSSWADNLATVGTPAEESPYLFVSKLEIPTPPPTATPTSTPTINDEGDEGEGEDDTSPEPGALPIVDVRDRGKVDIPAQIEVVRGEGQKFATIIITLPEVRIDASLFGKLRKRELIGLAANGVRVKYEVEIRKSGAKQRITRVSSRNVVAVRKLTPGKYTVRYRVTATKGKKTVRTRQSPPASITIT